MTTHQIGRFLVLGSSASFALSSLSVHWAYTVGFNAYNLHFAMSLIAAIALLATPRARGWTSRLREPLVWLYGLAGASSGLLFGMALLYVQPGLATLLFYTYPVAVTLGAAIVYRRRPQWRDGLALALTAGGAALTVGPLHGSGSWLGVLIVAASMAGYALYVLLGERVVADWPAPAATAAMRAMQAGLVIVIAPIAATRVPAGPVTAWLPALLLVTVTALFGFLLLTEGLARVNASVAALLTAAELPVAMALSSLLLGERFTIVQVLGAALIIAGLVWSEAKGRTSAVSN